MARQTTALLSFNRGLVSRRGLARVDVKRVQMSAEVMTNFIPTVLGSMSIRPGWKYLGGIQGHNPAKLIPFIFAIDDTAIIEITSGVMRVWRIDELIERGTVGTGITNGAFGTDLTGWTDADEAGAASTWLTGGYMQLLGDGTNAAIRYQEVTVSGGDAGDEHALRVTIARGPVLIRVGSTAGAENYIGERSLGTGVHSLAFTPAGNFFVQFFSRESYPVLVDAVSIEAAGVMTVTAPWSASDLDLLRWDQSGDIIFVACEGEQPRMILRWSANSWAIVLYEPTDGPFRIENTTAITIAPSAITGAITLTASKLIFKTTHVGALFSITSEGQTVTASISAQNTFTDPIRITGVDSSRVFTIILSGTWSATVTLQRSLDSEDGPWEDVTTFSANTTETFDDGLDNVIAWYRIGVKTGQYTSGTVVASLDYALGSITGVVKITAYTSGTSVDAIVLRDLGGTDATAVWAEGEWSDFRGWPTAVALHEGRLWWAGLSKVWGSITDALDSFDPDVEGDAGTIARRITPGPVDRVNWLFSAQRLVIGADINLYAARSSSLDEPLTPTQFNIKATGDQGASAIMPGRLDSAPVYANRTGMKVFQHAIAGQTFDFSDSDLCQLVPEIGDPQIVRLAVQIQPNKRIHAIRSDGTVGLAVFDKTEDVLGWCEVETDGEVEDAIVLPAQPGVQDDYVYYVVKRDIDGEEVRYLEKWAQTQNTRGGVGLAGDESPYKAFSLFEVSMTDFNVASGGTLHFWYSVLTEKFYALGDQTDDIYEHTLDPFTPPGVPTGTASGTVLHEPNSGCITREGRYVFLSADTGSATVRVYDVVDQVWVDLGRASVSAANSCFAAREEPQLEVIINNASGGGISLFRPNLGTGALGAAIWTVTGINENTWPWTWDGNDTCWATGTTGFYQIDVNTGTRATHSYPPAASAVGFAGVVAYDSNNEMIYVVLKNPGSAPQFLYSWSDWNATPTADSGTWTQIAQYENNPYIGRHIWYDAEEDILFMAYIRSTFGTEARILRYVGNPKVLLDEVFTVSDDNPLIDIFGYFIIGTTVFYKDGAGYVVVGLSGGSTHLMKILYAGEELLEDTDGNPLIPGGVTGRLHDLADSYVNYDTAGPVVDGLEHLEGESVVVWANGVDLGTDDDYAQTYVVTAGALDPELDAEYSAVTVGLPYTAQFKSSKLAIATQMEMLFGKEKRITEISFVLADTHAKGIRFGPDFDTLDDRPLREGWADIDPDEITDAYDEDAIQFQSGWATDLRVCLQAQAPRPCTVLAVKLTIEV